MKVRLTFTRELLGSCPNDADLYRNWIAKNVPTEKADKEAATLPVAVADEVVDDIETKGTSVFRRTPDDTPALADYTIKGFFKDAASMLGRISPTKTDTGEVVSPKLVAFKKIIDGLVFIFPEFIALALPEGAAIGYCVRPLRAQTAKGERVSLARSESVPAGTTCEFDIRCMDPKLEPVVSKWLDYGEFRGLGSWRNSGKGMFTWERIDK